MKLLLLIICSLSSVSAQAEYVKPLVEKPVMSDSGTITIKSEKGVKVVSSDDYVVVKRRKHKVHKKPTVVASVMTGNTQVMCPKAIVWTTFEESHKNSIKLYGGVGAEGLTAAQAGSTYHVNQNYGLNFGVGYEREVAKHWQVEGILIGSPSGFTSGLAGVGYKF